MTNIEIQYYANRLVVPPGPTPTLMQETAKKRPLETGAIGSSVKEKKMQDRRNYGAILNTLKSGVFEWGISISGLYDWN